MSRENQCRIHFDDMFGPHDGIRSGDTSSCSPKSRCAGDRKLRVVRDSRANTHDHLKMMSGQPPNLRELTVGERLLLFQLVLADLHTWCDHALDALGGHVHFL